MNERRYAIEADYADYWNRLTSEQRLQLVHQVEDHYMTTFVGGTGKPWWQLNPEMKDAIRAYLKEMGEVYRGQQQSPQQPYGNVRKATKRAMEAGGYLAMLPFEKRMEYLKRIEQKLETYNVAGYVEGMWHWGTATKRPDGNWDFKIDRQEVVHVLSPRHIKIYGKLLR